MAWGERSVGNTAARGELRKRVKRGGILLENASEKQRSLASSRIGGEKTEKRRGKRGKLPAQKRGDNHGKRGMPFPLKGKEGRVLKEHTLQPPFAQSVKGGSSLPGTQ